MIKLQGQKSSQAKMVGVKGQVHQARQSLSRKTIVLEHFNVLQLATLEFRNLIYHVWKLKTGFRNTPKIQN